MTDRFNRARARLGDWTVFCDICGQKVYASETTRLSQYTGRGGLIVCKHDVDKIDYGLVPYTPRTERHVPWTRVNHTDTTDGSINFDIETVTAEEFSSYIFIMTSQGDYLSPSQEDSYLIAS